MLQPLKFLQELRAVAAFCTGLYRPVQAEDTSGTLAWLLFIYRVKTSLCLK
jgi:hypothetical protein